MTKLSKYEKETIILFNEGEDTASIYTYNAGLKNAAGRRSVRSTLTSAGRKGHTRRAACPNILDKSRLSVRLQPPYSEERRKKASEYARQNGFNSQPE